MGKYVWPRDIVDASYWYLVVMRELTTGTSLDEILAKITTDPKFGVKPSRRQLQRQLYRLSDAGWIERQGAYTQSRYAITATGLERLNQLEEMSFIGQVQTATQWDGRWRLVTFDIPEAQREARYHIRRLLKELGFVQLQLSVWIHPLPLLQAFQQIQTAYGISDHLFLLEVVDFVPPATIQTTFRRRYPKLQLS